MVESAHCTDSRQLAALRARFKLDHPDQHGSPHNLGCYARRKGIPIDDFGAHSVRWIRNFEAGRSHGPRLLRPRQLRLFNP
jgi:hypothetical protein